MDRGRIEAYRQLPRRLLPALAVALLVLTEQARALNIQTYFRTDGIPQNQVKAVIQDGRGYIWLGTHSGLSRYNGQSFRTLTTADGLSSNSIDHLALDREGRLIVGTWNGGVCFHERPGFSCLGKKDGLPSDAIQALELVGDTLWVGTDAGLATIDPDRRNISIPDASLADHSILDIAHSDRGIWVATGKGVVLLAEGKTHRPAALEARNGPVEAVTVHDGTVYLGGPNGVHEWQGKQLRSTGWFPDHIKQPQVTDFTAARDGTLWVASESGVVRNTGKQVTFTGPDQGLSDPFVHDIFIDREETVWFGTNTGLNKLVPSPFQAYTQADGLNHPFVRSVAEAPDGRLWLGTREGVNIFDNGRIRSLPLPAPWPREKIYAIERAPEGGMLIGSRRGLMWWQGGKTRRFTIEDGLPSIYLGSLETDPGGGVWLGTKSGLAKWKDGRVRTIDHPELENRFILAMHEDGPGNVWLGLARGGVLHYDGTDVEVYDDSRGLTDQTIWTVEKGVEGSVWIGSNGDGAFRIKGDTVERMNARNGLASNFVWQILCDDSGRIWFYTNSGLDRLEDDQLLHYGKSSGLIALEGSTNAAIQHSSGDLFFGTGRGLVRFSSDFRLDTTNPPPVRIESVQTPAGAQLASGVELSHDYGNLLVEYAALTFRTESAIRFRTRVLGLEEDWSEPTGHPRFRLGQLPAGEYEFQVIARNDIGEWSDAPATFRFRVLPVWWQTFWFWGVALVGLVAATGGYVQLRLRRLRTVREQLQQRVDEQTARLQESNQELRRLSITDELTGLFNRRHLVENLEREVERLNRAGGGMPLSLAIIDIDHFKQVNDVHGHLVGDRVLEAVGKHIAERVRQTDMAARYGGEEFAIVMPMTDEDGARTLAEDLRNSFSDEAVREIPGKPLRLTVSIGVATQYGAKTDVDSRDRMEQLVRRADAALYEAKSGGRNRVETDAES